MHSGSGPSSQPCRRVSGAGRPPTPLAGAPSPTRGGLLQWPPTPASHMCENSQSRGPLSSSEGLRACAHSHPPAVALIRHLVSSPHASDQGALIGKGQSREKKALLAHGHAHPCAAPDTLSPASCPLPPTCAPSCPRSAPAVHPAPTPPAWSSW